MLKRVSYIVTSVVCCLALPLISGAVTVTSKAQFEAELPLTPGKTITVSDQTISGGGAWGALVITGDCTLASPCIIEAQSQDGVIFSGQGAGTFRLSGKYLTFRKFKFTGSTSHSSTAQTNLVAFDGCQNCTVDSVTMDTFTGSGDLVAVVEYNGGRETLNNTISNSTFANYSMTNVGNWIQVFGQTALGFPEGITITGNTFRNRVCITTERLCFGLRVGNGYESLDAANYSGGHPGIVVTNNTFRDTTYVFGGQDEIHFKASNVVVSGNIFERASRITNRSGQNWVFTGNKILNPITTPARDAVVFYQSGHVICNNLFVNTGASRTALRLGNGNPTDTNGDGKFDYTAVSNSILCNNTFWGFKEFSIDADRVFTADNDGATTVRPSSLTYHNNVIYQETGTMFDGASGCGIFVSVSHNARNGAATADCQASGTNNVTAAAEWTNPAGGDFSLQDVSPLIDAGTTVAGTTAEDTDLTGASRTGGNAPPDIGAYEFQAVGGGPNTWYVDPACTTSGDGTGQTCDISTGPFVSLEDAIDEANNGCDGMAAGDTIIVKGMSTAPSNGNWYPDDQDYFDPSVNVNVDVACSGITIQNESNDYVVFDGTDPYQASSWTSLGTGTYECTSGCGGGNDPDYLPFGFYDRGAGEERLDLVHSAQTCTAGITAGTMRYEPSPDFDTCVRLSNDSDPSAATYLRFPRDNFLTFSTSAASNITIRKNPDGTGGILIARYKQYGAKIDPSLNVNITFDGVDFQDIGQKAIEVTGTPGVANLTVKNSTFTRMCEAGVQVHGDLGVVTIDGNTFIEIGDTPYCEACDGVGSGCLGTYDEDAAAISLNNQTAIDDLDNIFAINNVIHDGGGGYRGLGYGIVSRNATHANVIENNNIYDGTASTAYKAIAFVDCTADPCHDHIRVRNNRLEDVDMGVVVDFNPTVTTQTVSCRSFIYGNTVLNASTSALVQEDGPNTGCEFWTKDNLFVSTDGDGVELVDIPSSTNFPESTFQYNGFECSHANCSVATIATLQGSAYQREGDCTPSTDCVEDYGLGNAYLSPSNVQATTLQVTSGGEGIDAGVALAFLGVDYLGTPRPFGSAPDMGAFEFTGGSPTTNLTQRAYLFSGAYAANDSAEALAPESTTSPVYGNSRFNLTVSITGDAAIQEHISDFVLYYQHCNPSCGAYVAVNTVCGGNPVCLDDNPSRSTDEPISSNILALGGRTFLPTSHYIDADDPNGGEVVNVLISADQQLELTYALRIGSLAMLGDVINFRAYYSAGGALNTYLVTPTLEIGVGRFNRAGGVQR